ncbi:MAG: hypothetical protein ACOC6A_05815 [Chloroflexota bacterium]
MSALLVPVLNAGLAEVGPPNLWGLDKLGVAVTVFLVILIGLAAAWLINGTRMRD